VLLAAMLVVLVLSVPAFVLLRRARPLSRAVELAYVGLVIAYLGVVLTPGIAWGDVDDDSALRPLSTLVFYIGIGVLIWAAVTWVRTRSRSDQRSR
jgi:hypothetical protein